MEDRGGNWPSEVVSDRENRKGMRNLLVLLIVFLVISLLLVVALLVLLGLQLLLLLLALFLALLLGLLKSVTLGALELLSQRFVRLLFQTRLGPNQSEKSFIRNYK